MPESSWPRSRNVSCGSRSRKANTSRSTGSAMNGSGSLPRRLRCCGRKLRTSFHPSCPVSTPPASSASAAGRLMKFCAASTRHEDVARHLARGLAAAGPPPGLAVVRGPHPGDSLLAESRPLPLRELAVDSRGHGGHRRSAHPAGLDHRLGPVVEDHRTRADALLHHHEPPRAGAVARRDRRGRPRLLGGPPAEAFRPESALGRLMPTGIHRHKRKSNSIHFNNAMVLLILGAHNKTNLQRRSIRWLVGDETWR